MLFPLKKRILFKRMAIIRSLIKAKNVNMDWKLYEEVTRSIYEALGKSAGVKIEGYGNDCRVKGKSEVEHQIDVLTSHSDGVHIYKTAIECKYWKDLVNKDIVMKVVAIIEDAGIDKGVVVSKQGFTEDAISFAKHTNIGLVELREIQDDDLIGEPSIEVISSTVRRPEINNIIIIPSLFNRSDVNEENVEYNCMILKKLNGDEVAVIDYIKEFQKELHTHPVNKMVEKKIFIPMSTLINTLTGKTLFIDGLIFNGVLTERDAGLKFYPVDEVWLIMKAIFEDRAYTISKKGIIREKKYKIS